MMRLLQFTKDESGFSKVCYIQEHAEMFTLDWEC